MSIIPPEVEEQAVQETGLPYEPSIQNSQARHDKPARIIGAVGIVLGVLALCFATAAGLWLYRSLRRLDRRVGQLNQQVGQLNRRIGSTEQQSQSLAQQATQAAASAQAAAQQRDDAKKSEQTSAAQAQSAMQEAATAKQQADQAQQKAEEYRKQREEELQQLQQALGQIAETHRTAMGLVMTLGEKSIHFDFDKADIKPQYRDILNRIAGILMTLKGYSIYVYGYTDDVGTKDYNLKLSSRRAQAVRDALVQAGIKSSTLTTKGFGKSDPRVKGNTAKARAANRRVEIGIVDSKLVVVPPSQKSQK